MVYPPGGWARAFQYVKHRVRRLPDKPERIARGIWVGVFTAFTPFYGLHFLIAAILAKVMNANMLSALTGTFFGNPLTYLPIGAISLETGHFLLGTRAHPDTQRSLGGKFADAWSDLYHNFFALFTDVDADWTGLSVFYHEVFFPYMVGGLLPGVIAATICYYLSVPVIHAYQIRRAMRIRKKFEEIKQTAGAGDETPADAGRDAG